MEKRGFDLMRLWRVYVLVATSFTIMTACSVLSLNEEGQLLLNWKQDHLDDPDKNLSNWNAADAIPCFWNGVNCTQGSVFGVDFSPFLNLGGDIYTLSFVKFANFTTLNVGNTMLGGIFSEDIVNCLKLVYLNLSETHISGEVPPDIVNLQRLQVLDLTWAEMVGTVMTRFDKLPKLRVLRLGGNHFEDQMPQSLMKVQELTVT